MDKVIKNYTCEKVVNFLEECFVGKRWTKVHAKHLEILCHFKLLNLHSLQQNLFELCFFND
jgi:hypothetical protein